MQHDAEINAILDQEERAADERALWMAGLPKELGTLVRVAIASVYTVCAIRWHERNGGLSSGWPTMREAKTMRDDLVNHLEGALTQGDFKMFNDCMNLIEDMSHYEKECPLCSDTPFVFSDKVVWEMLAV
jgi:hypothetical protein